MTNPEKPLIVVITGAESTGKSLLTQQLGKHFACPVFPEYAREYLEKKGPVYDYNDVLRIARKQKKQMRDALRGDSAFVFFDTWLIITKVWLEVVYGNVPEWIVDSIRNATVDLYILCSNDIPWIPDSLRENGGNRRDLLFEMYRDNLIRFGFKYKVLEGTGEERFRNALEIIDEML